MGRQQWKLEQVQQREAGLQVCQLGHSLKDALDIGVPRHMLFAKAMHACGETVQPVQRPRHTFMHAAHQHVSLAKTKSLHGAHKYVLTHSAQIFTQAGLDEKSVLHHMVNPHLMHIKVMPKTP